MNTELKAQATQKASQVFSCHAERLASAWRNARHQDRHPFIFHSSLDSLAECFIQEIGNMLNGSPGAPWTRCQGVLRLCRHHGAEWLCEEFTSLRRCLFDALEALETPPSCLTSVHLAFDQALSSALTYLECLGHIPSPLPEVPFGGIVVEIFHSSVPTQEHVFQATPATRRTTLPPPGTEIL